MKVDVWPSVLAGRVDAPGSKSDAQRMVACALLAKGTSVIRRFPQADDCEAALSVAQDLGAIITRTGSSIEIKGGFPQAFISGIRNAKDVIDCGESGLSSRMFAAIASLSEEPVSISGVGSLLQRPFDNLIETLEQCGVHVESDHGRLPLRVHGPLKGGHIHLDASVSSQFLTGLLIALSRAAEPSVVDVSNLTSKPYIDLTLSVLSQFGLEITHEHYGRFHISPKAFKATELIVPGDWSGSSFLLVAGAICADEGLTVDNLKFESAQADEAVLNALRAAEVRFEMGENSVRVWKSDIRAFEFDATHCPDLFPPLVALAAFADGVTVLHGASRLIHKESNRAKTLQQEFAKAGIRIVLRDDEMKIYPAAIRSALLHSHGDHRIAMAGALLGMGGAHMTIQHASVVAKSFPGFYSLMKALGARITGA
jgi:3-phosphoshikimate 1-carboxyvinyltransferase